MKTHELKIEEKFFNDVTGGKKTFELRKNDRDFKVDDMIALCEIDKNKKKTGRMNYCKITYILQGYEGLKKGFCILGIEFVCSKWS